MTSGSLLDRFYFIGIVWVAIGLLAVIGFSLAHFLQPPPMEGKLRIVSGTLLGKAEFHCPSKAPAWAEIRLKTKDGVTLARVDNVSLLGDGCCGSTAIKSLTSGDHVTVQLQDTRVWSIKNERSVILSYQQSMQAEQSLLIRRISLFGVILILGTIPIGFRIYKKRFSSRHDLLA